MPDRLIDKAEVTRLTSLCDVTIWRLERNGQFPPRRKISGNRVAYLESEVLDWIAARPVVKSKAPATAAA